ncbi:MAG: NADH-quinone oxidoreductase subunit J [Desulfofustis sp.]|nr:NADH-quinone oxidoreductase subunit J [Desulfofustis sp.]MBT8354775.1 NADH-quinone oxidoreductase subunit J [Desulfofustis sp.]NNF47384.1 NADH-quinone oxidoreductase subunit J [Desulfofustis sp.]NNK56155.1 NADH-quinone oxidoreductase subunit J [Desulfofustis sp.]
MLAVLGALGLIIFKHPMNGAMSFVMTLISMAGLYALLSAKLIFAIQLIVYAGAIMSLILFIIMFLNIQEKDLPLDPNRWFYLAGGIIVVAPIAGLLIKISKSLPATEVTVFEDGFGGVKEVGQLLFSQWLLPFEIVSILLLVALVGAVVLAGKREVN